MFDEPSYSVAYRRFDTTLPPLPKNLPEPEPTRGYPSANWRWWDIALLGIGIAVCLLIWTPVAQRLADRAIDQENNPDLAFVVDSTAGFAAYLMVLVTALGGALLLGKRWRDFGFSLPPDAWVWALVAVGVALIFIPVRVVLVVILVILFDPTYFTSQQQDDGMTFSGEFDPLLLVGGLQLLIMVTVFAPIVEELVFRGILQPWLRRRFGVVISILGSGVLFGLAHQQTYMVISNSVMGIVLALMYEYSGSLWMTMLMHFVNNAVVVLLVAALLVLVVLAGGA